MGFPYANRVIIGSLSDLALAKKPATVKELIDEFQKQYPDDRLECVQLIKGRTIRVCFKSEEPMTETLAGGLSFRGFAIELKAPTWYRWVSVLDLPYGIPGDQVSTTMSKFGQVDSVIAEAHKGVYTGTRIVKMILRDAIPSRITIAGHTCTIFYRGQVRSCFRCGNAGHEAKKCPQRENSQNHDHDHSREQPSTTPLTSPRIFSGQLAPSPRTFVDAVRTTVNPENISGKRKLDQPRNTTSPNNNREIKRKQPCVPQEILTSVNSELTHPSVRESAVVNDISEHNAPGAEALSITPAKMDVSAVIETTGDISKQSVPDAEILSDSPPKIQRTTKIETSDRDRSPQRRKDVKSGKLDRRLVSVRTKEFHSKYPDPHNETDHIQSILQTEDNLSSKKSKRRTKAKETLAYEHVILDFNFAMKAYESVSTNLRMAHEQGHSDVLSLIATKKICRATYMETKDTLIAFQIEHGYEMAEGLNPHSDPGETVPPNPSS